VIQLGENPKFVFNVGGIGTENIRNFDLLGIKELEEALDFTFGEKNLLVTFHPTTLDSENPTDQLDQLLDALSELSDTKIIFTLPNADTGGREFIKRIEEFVSRNSNSRSYVSLGQLLYFSCVSQVDGVLGNSSSGLLEVPSFKKGSINIGDRQEGRMQALSVINCHPAKLEILDAIEKLYSVEFQRSLELVKNPYEGKDSVKSIVKKLSETGLTEIVKKRFYDL
jgi:GDP/UDP-N,N'-diacetylbacillosamine 2-epimerase (hydrolysing)